jgi:hypothetical protein
MVTLIFRESLPGTTLADTFTRVFACSGTSYPVACIKLALPVIYARNVAILFMMDLYALPESVSL